MPHGIANFGLYAMNAMRMEKGYRGWGTELTTEVTPVEAGMERFVKAGGAFIGAGAVRARQEQDAGIRLVYCSVDAADADPMGNEPVYDAERVIGITTSGAYGFTVRRSLAFAYVESAYAAPGTTFEVGILGERRRATVHAEALYDPGNERLRA